jgi:hypothetical protein
LISDDDNLFLAQEDYPEVLKICAALHNLPNRRSLPFAHLGDQWEVISNEEYQHILALADPSFNFFDSIQKDYLNKHGCRKGGSPDHPTRAGPRRGWMI